ncbi:MAG: nicotinate phosphoribosyltransferase [Vicinamibacteria bacterium]|nr:nicotinate phosphoribosyltransferase [Vicinamibacteria bacterium]
MPSALATDLYQVTMMAGYHASGQDQPRTFELFVRGLPDHRQYLVAAGLEQALEYLANLHFTPDEIGWLRTLPALADVPSSFFDAYLPAFRFTGDVWAVEEGEVIFSHEPVLRVTAPAGEAQLVETALLAIITFQTSVASKASRVVNAADGRAVIEFGSRRAHGLDAALHAARAAYIAGCVSTSNVEAGRLFGIPVSGTMAHSWVMGCADEIDAFRQYMQIFGAHTTLLIDTYDTLTAARRIVASGLRPTAVRLDSGDLLALSTQVHQIFDEGGLGATRILVSGDLDEHRIQTLVRGGAPIDGFGVGTAISAVSDAPALGGVYKLVETTEAGQARPTVKLSTGKRTFPGRKQVWRVTETGIASHDVMGLADEAGQEGRPLLSEVMRRGARVAPSAPLDQMRQRCKARVAQLPAALRALESGPPYTVRVSGALDQLLRLAVHRVTG